MNDVILILINQVLIMFALMMVGFLLFKKKMISIESTGVLSDIVLYIATPATILSSFFSEFSQDRLVFGLWTLLLTIVVMIISIILITTIFSKKSNITKFGIVFNNVGFLGIPLIKNVLGTESVFYMTIYVVAITLLVWTLGIYLVTEDKGMMSIKKILLNPNIIMTGVGLIIFTFSIELPMMITTTVNYLGNLNAPLAMMVLGCYLALSDFEKVLKNKDTVIICFGRIILIPLITLVVLKTLPSSLDMIKTVILIGSATPVAGVMGMFCQKYGKDYSYGAGVVGISTLISLITMPLFLYFLYTI